jgi:two-component system, sensor histidine kinase and response regulator
MNKNKILLVEDELNLRETISEFLTYENYDIKTANNGQEALDILDYWMPDLIISDIMMPVMDGNMFHEIVMENNTLNAIPFIFLTAKKEIKIKRKCLLDGADDFMSKPFKFDDLIKTIQSKINRFEKIKNSYNNIYTGSKNVFSHEINTSLNGIIGSIDLLMDNEDSFDKNEIATFYDAIKISGERLKRTMQNLILYQNIKNNAIDFTANSHSDIFKTCLIVKKNILKFYENQEKRIHFKIDTAKIKISPNHLQFILFELIDNALKFSDKEKKVIISGTKYNDEFYELNVIDNGIGFSEEEIRKIQATQQFNREENEQQGLGLGLFLSKTIVKKSNGVFSIISKKDQSTTIKLFLPLDCD